MILFCDHSAVLSQREVYHRALISKVNTIQISMLLSFPDSFIRISRYPIHCRHLLPCFFSKQVAVLVLIFFNLPTMSYHVTVVFVRANWYQQVLLLTLMKSSSTALLGTLRYNRKTKTSPVPSRWADGWSSWRTPSSPTQIHFYLSNQVEHTICTSKNTDL